MNMRVVYRDVRGTVSASQTGVAIHQVLCIPQYIFVD